MKIRPMGAELFQADGQTDMTKIMISLHNMANAPKMGPIIREMNQINHNSLCYTDLSTAKNAVDSTASWV